MLSHGKPCNNHGQPPKQVVGRFAPSPTGRMHAGNIFAALMSWLIVKAQGGRIVLRIEDLDVERSKSSYIDQIQRDFENLGLTWDEGPYFQNNRNEAYQAAFDSLVDRGLVYPCFCTRADLHAASAPHRGEKLVYAGTCRDLSPEDVRTRMADRKPSYRLVVPNEVYKLTDRIQGPYEQNLAIDCGDYVIRRSDGLFAYQLAVVVDDGEQGVNCIVRGMDLLCSTPQQMYMQDLLGYETAQYAHVPLVVGEKDRRLSKRDYDAALDELLAAYKTPEAVIGHIAGITGLTPTTEPVSCEELLASFDLDALPRLFPDNVQIQWW
ncbi:MAG: tRNA glutamyl-Q(34) synthetase GluQRS [Eggerthellaceae bacterium]|nr:tRNA glutamyl-Q(34) synthetase GluQRS [Eggerthellaceae bacterium]